ncbi:MAG: hypothetical protein N2512_13230 [Armatimonadetes bacterium]|nr:hypothetical protein [Armatimonadota bacterium]
MKPSNNTKTAIVVIALILVIPMWNFIAHGAAGVFKSKPKTEEHTQPAKPQHIEVPKPIGPEKAPVKVTVFINSANPCHAETINALKQLPQEYPNQVRVVFKDTKDPANAKAAAEAKIGCEMGLLVNGRMAFRLPGRGLVMFQGPLMGGAGHGVNMNDLHLVIESQVKEKTGRPARRVQVKGAPPSASPAQPQGPQQVPGHVHSAQCSHAH